MRAAIGGKIIARGPVKAMRKDVLARVLRRRYRPQGRSCWKSRGRQKKMRQLKQRSLPSEAFTAVLKLDSDDD